jgi:hypothetical protein
MVMRVRPGWEELRAYLAGEAEPALPGGRPKQRFDVYVCTAAERPYALEVRRSGEWGEGKGGVECVVCTGSGPTDPADS